MARLSWLVWRCVSPIQLHFLQKKLTSFYSYAGFVLANCVIRLVHRLCYYQRLSELHSFRVRKTVHGDSRKIGHVSHSSLKRVASPDSALFLMSVYKTSRSRLNSFLLPRLRVRFFLQVAASLVMLFVENCHRETPLHGGPLHCQLSGFLPNLVLQFGIINWCNIRYWQCMASL